MLKQTKTISYLAVVFVWDIVAMQLAIPASVQLRYALPVGREIMPAWAPYLFYSPTPWMHFVVLILWVVALVLASVYTPRRVALWGEELQHLLLGYTTAALLFAGVLYLSNKELPRLTYVYLFVIGLALMIGMRVVLRVWQRLRHRNVIDDVRVLIAGDCTMSQTVIAQMAAHAWPGLSIVGVLRRPVDAPAEKVNDIPVLGTTDVIADVVARQAVDAVVIAVPRDAHLATVAMVSILDKLPVRVYVVPDYFDLAFHGATVESVGSVPMIGLRDPAIDGLQRLFKRIMDIVISAAGLVILSPVLAIIAALIKLDDHGPAIYRTARVGENGRVFYMYKFRSMRVGADTPHGELVQSDAGVALNHKRPDDPRVTRMGRFLRRMSLDELPQLVNVIRGEMSLVGPRPELPWLVDLYAPWQRKRFSVPQGMTGWWQVSGRSENPMHLHTDQDLYYIQNYSLWLDLRIVWRTIAVVLRGKGAY